MKENFITKNPMTDEVLWEGTASGKQEIDSVVSKARNALITWSFLSFEQRAEYLISFKKAIQSKKLSFAEISKINDSWPWIISNNSLDYRAVLARYRLVLKMKRQYQKKLQQLFKSNKG